MKFEYYCRGYTNICYKYIVTSVCYVLMLGSILTDYSFKLMYVFFSSNFYKNSKIHHIND